MSASDRVLGKAEAILQIVEDKLATVDQLVASLQQYERRLAVSTPDIERLRDIVPDLREVVAGLKKTTWMTSTQLARYLHLHRDTITAWAREGKLPGHRVGVEDWRFDASEVDLAIKREEVMHELARPDRTGEEWAVNEWTGKARQAR